MTNEETEARAGRHRAILFGGASAGVARAAGMVCGLIQVPLALSVLGREGFGLWATLQATVAFIGMLDFGIGYRLQNSVAECVATKTWGEIRRSVRSVAVLTLGLAGVLAVIAMAAGAAFWTDLLGIEDLKLRETTAPYLSWFVVLACVSLPANIGIRLASGMQKNWLVGASQALASVINLAFVLWCVAAGASAVVLLTGTLLVPLAANGALLVALWRGLPSTTPTNPDARATSRWIREGLPFFLPQLCGSLRVNLPPFIIASVLGAAAVTPYNLIQRLLNFVAQPQSWLLDPLWPAYTDAAIRGDLAWTKRALRLSLIGSAVFSLLPILSVLGWGPRFVQWWTGYPAASLATGLLFWLVVAQAALTMTQPLTLCLNGMGRLHGQAIYGTISVIGGLIGMAFVCQNFGLGQAVAPIALVLALFNLPCAYLDLRRQLSRWSTSGPSAKAGLV